MQIANEPMQVKGYSQGGTVVNGIAYFTANSYQEKLDEQGMLSHVDKVEPYPYLVAFDVKTLQVIRTYPFENTYDSTPIVLPNKAGELLVVAHEYIKGRTVAMRQETGEVVWVSEENQPGGMFFGYSYFVRRDGTTLLLISIKNGLHAISLENGKEEWLVAGTSGVTPCVDQELGVLYWQANGKMTKIDAETGEILITVPVNAPSSCVSWNTVLAKDDFGTHIATYWYSPNLYGSAIRVFDDALGLKWEKTGLPMSKKASLTYHGGKIFVGSGDHWQKYPDDDSRWKRIQAYNATNGELAWELDLSDYAYASIPNLIYCNGVLIAETQSNKGHLGYYVFCMDAETGKMLKEYYKKPTANSCAAPLFTGGKLFSGDLVTDSILITSIGSGRVTDWIGAFGNGQTHTMCAQADALVSLAD